MLHKKNIVDNYNINNNEYISSSSMNEGGRGGRTPNFGILLNGPAVNLYFKYKL